MSQHDLTDRVLERLDRLLAIGKQYVDVYQKQNERLTKYAEDKEKKAAEKDYLANQPKPRKNLLLAPKTSEW